MHVLEAIVVSINSKIYFKIKGTVNKVKYAWGQKIGYKVL